MDRQEVFIVMQGEYSDQMVAGVFSTKAKANEFIRRNGEDYWLIDCKQFYLDGLVGNVGEDLHWRIVRGYASLTFVNDPNDYYEKLSGCIRCVGEGACIEFFVPARTRDIAKKIAHDMYSSVIANAQTMYPLLRNKNVLSNGCYPLYDFRTGEIVLEAGQKLSEEYEGRVKTRNI